MSLFTTMNSRKPATSLNETLYQRRYEKEFWVGMEGIMSEKIMQAVIITAVAMPLGILHVYLITSPEYIHAAIVFDILFDGYVTGALEGGSNVYK